MGVTEHLSQQEVVSELFLRAFAAGLSVGIDSTGIRLWVHVVYGGNRYYLEWPSGGGARRRIVSPVGDETDWPIYEQAHCEWALVEDGRGGA